MSETQLREPFSALLQVVYQQQLLELGVELIFEPRQYDMGCNHSNQCLNNHAKCMSLFSFPIVLSREVVIASLY